MFLYIYMRKYLLYICMHYFVDLIIINILLRLTPPKNFIGTTAYGSDSDYGGINVKMK